MGDTRTSAGSFPLSAGILFGLGLGGFFNGIVLHSWHRRRGDQKASTAD
jgi:uncharacterized membrane protein